MSSVSAWNRLARVTQHIDLDIDIDEMSKKRKAEQLAPWTTASGASSSSAPSQSQSQSQSSPAPTVSKSSAMADVPNVPHSEAATMYSSRQIPLFDENKNPTVHRQDLSIRDVGVYTLAHLSSFLPKLPEYDNHFRRTKIPMSLQPAVLHHHHHHGSPSPSPSPSPTHTRSTHATPQSSTTTTSSDFGHTSVRTAATPAPATMGLGTADECHEKEIHELTYNQLIHDEIVLMDIVRRPELSTSAKGFVRAGPREKIVWAEGEVKAAIVTCGGLCPGLNDVVCELFSTLYYNYGVNEIYGIRSGFRGFWDPEFAPWLTLTPTITRTIHEQGGTVLGSSRGGFDCDKIITACLQKGVNQIYIIGGDGTHRAADAIQHEARKRGLKMTVAGVPKTIDNDIGVIDRSFGFSTAVNEAVKAIKSAAVEASCAPNGLGIVQLMGRHAGYISAHATLASRAVDLCLIPEVKFPMTGPNGVLSLIEDILKRQGFAVVVVAEGAGAEHCSKSKEVDESGNARLPEIGRFLQAQITQHFKQKKRDVSIKYHDPSYMIRSVPANADDSVYCQVLAQNAVHGAMAGYTGFTSGLVNNRTVLLPISVVTATSPSYLNPNGRTWERVVTMTHQPKWSLLNK